MRAFSRIQINSEALKVKIRRAKNMARGQINSDFDKNHPAEVRSAQNKQFGELTKRITEEVTKQQTEAITRRAKLIGK